MWTASPLSSESTLKHINTSNEISAFTSPFTQGEGKSQGVIALGQYSVPCQYHYTQGFLNEFLPSINSRMPKQSHPVNWNCGLFPLFITNPMWQHSRLTFLNTSSHLVHRNALHTVAALLDVLCWMRAWLKYWKSNCRWKGNWQNHREKAVLQRLDISQSCKELYDPGRRLHRR